jgi:NADPH2:quinone reductase
MTIRSISFPRLTKEYVDEKEPLSRGTYENDAQASQITTLLPDTMRALRMVKESASGEGTKDRFSLQLVEARLPTVTPGTVLVQVHATAINPSDAANANGFFSYTIFPRIPGRDFAGTVVVGPSYLQGQRVFGTSGKELSFSLDGCHAEYCLVPEDGVVIIPAGMSFAQAATIGVPFTTAWLTLERSHTKASDTVLVIGAYGAVGSAVCQLAREKGCRVITAARRDTADINLLVDPELKGVRAMTGGGPTVVVDTVGDPDLMRRAMDILPTRGRLSYISAPKTFEVEFSFNMKGFYRAEKEIIGCNSLSYSIQEMGEILGELRRAFARGVCQTIEESKIIGVKLTEDALVAYQMVRGGKSQKYVICP